MRYLAEILDRQYHSFWAGENYRQDDELLIASVVILATWLLAIVAVFLGFVILIPQTTEGQQTDVRWHH